MRSAFAGQLTDMEDWLYMDGDSESAEVYRKKLKELEEKLIVNDGCRKLALAGLGGVGKT